MIDGEKEREELSTGVERAGEERQSGRGAGMMEGGEERQRKWPTSDEG